MAKLIGYLETQTGKRTSRTDQRIVESRLETWEGAIVTRLYADGKFEVSMGAKDEKYPETFATGNVNDGERMVQVPSLRDRSMALGQEDEAHSNPNHVTCERCSLSVALQQEACAYPDDIHGEHDHAMCEDASTT